MLGNLTCNYISFYSYKGRTKSTYWFTKNPPVCSSRLPLFSPLSEKIFLGYASRQISEEPPLSACAGKWRRHRRQAMSAAFLYSKHRCEYGLTDGRKTGYDYAPGGCGLVSGEAQEAQSGNGRTGGQRRRDADMNALAAILTRAAEAAMLSICATKRRTRRGVEQLGSSSGS